MSRTFVADKTDLEGADLVAAHVGLLVLVAEDVQLDLVDPHAVLALAGEPAARGGLVGYWIWGQYAPMGLVTTAGGFGGG